jgi:hypothetical protein
MCSFFNYGSTVVMWDLDSGDSQGFSAAQSRSIYTDAIDDHPLNILALNHETYQSTAFVLVSTYTSSRDQANDVPFFYI